MDGGVEGSSRAYVIRFIVAHLTAFVRVLFDGGESIQAEGGHHKACVVATVYVASCSASILGWAWAAMEVSCCSSTGHALVIRLLLSGVRLVLLHSFSSNCIIQSCLVGLEFIVRAFD